MKKVNVEKAVSFADQYLYSAEPTMRALSYAFNANENVLLWGPPGYGKTEIGFLFHRFLLEEGIISDANPFVIPFNSSSRPDDLFPMDLPTFQKSGVMRINPTESFANFQLVLGDEVLDAPQDTLASLKTALAVRKIFNGDTAFDFRTRMFIGMTNHDTDEMLQRLDDHITAILERFTYRIVVRWHKTNSDTDVTAAHSIEAYLEAFKRNSNHYDIESRRIVAQICADTTAKRLGLQLPINPRIAYKALKLFVENDNAFEALTYFAELDPAVIKHAEKENKLEKKSPSTKTLLQTTESVVDQFNESMITKENVETLFCYLAHLNLQIDQEFEERIQSDATKVAYKTAQEKLSKCVGVVLQKLFTFGLSVPKNVTVYDIETVQKLFITG